MKTTKLWGWVLTLLTVCILASCGDEEVKPQPNGGKTDAEVEKAMRDIQFNMILLNTSETSVEFDVAMSSVSGEEYDRNDFEGYSMGICYCEASKGEPTVLNQKKDLTQATFYNLHERVEIAGLVSNQTYNFRYYLTYRDKVRYYNTIAVTPESEAGDKKEACYLQIKELEPTRIAISLKGYVNHDPFPSDIGLLYSVTNRLPTKESCDFVGSFYKEVARGEGETTVELNELQPGTTYYIRAYWVRNNRLEYFGHVMDDNENLTFQDVYAVTTPK